MPKGNKVSKLQYYNWTHQERNEKQKCFCGKFASFGVLVDNGFAVGLLCFEHWKEYTCQKEKEHTAQKSEDQKNQLNLL
jgi:hypothetical protein